MKEKFFGLWTLRYVRELNPKVNYFTDVEFRGFQQSLDAEMKRLRGEGIGVTRERAESISVKEEGELWEKGILGDSSPQVLLDTMVYCCGVYFALKEWGRTLLTQSYSTTTIWAPWWTTLHLLHWECCKEQPWWVFSEETWTEASYSPCECGKLCPLLCTLV